MFADETNTSEGTQIGAKTFNDHQEEVVQIIEAFNILPTAKRDQLVSVLGTLLEVATNAPADTGGNFIEATDDTPDTADSDISVHEYDLPSIKLKPSNKSVDHAIHKADTDITEDNLVSYNADNNQLEDSSVSLNDIIEMQEIRIPMVCQRTI